MTKIYVGNLPFSANENEIRELFAQHGTVESVSLITDRDTGRPRGFGFVEMSRADASRAIQNLNGKEMGGRPLRVNEAQERSSGGGGPRGPRPGGRPGGGPGGPREGGRKFFRRKKVCKFCVEKIDGINYKDVRLLSGFVAESGKIVPRRLTGVCTPHQRRLTDAIKQARNIALLPFGGR